jgi:hypothetical protein
MKPEMPTWEEWNEQLSQEQRNYFLFNVLVSMDGRLCALEKKRRWDPVTSGLGGMFGGITTVMVALKIKMWGS